MKTRVDRFGRVVLPKEVRDDLDLEAGCVLEVRETAEGVLLTPERPSDPFRTVRGVLVFDGKAEQELGDPVQADRERRTVRLSRGVARKRRRRS